MKVAFVALAITAATPATAATPFDGTWKVDMAKAQFSTKPNVYLLKDGTYVCKSCVPLASVKADGAFHPVSEQIGLDAMAVKIVDASTIDIRYRFRGKIIGETRRTISADGKTLTYSYTDFTAPVGKPPVNSGMETRVAPAPAGAHAVSGAWRLEQGSAKASDAMLTMTLKVEGKTVTMTMPTGVGYVAQVGGPAAPIKGDPAGTKATLRMPKPMMLVETDDVGGKVTQVTTTTVAADGKTMTMVNDDPIRKTRDTLLLSKQ